jgi:S1-C subfamily serine protease
MKRRFWTAGLGGAALLGMTAAGFAAADDAAGKDKTTRRVERVRIGGTKLGVAIEDGADRGALVTLVHEGSAAEKAGLRKGDVVLRFAGEDVRSAAQLVRLVRETPGGRTVDVEVSRDGAAQRMTVTLAKPDGDHLMSFGPGEFHFEMPEIDLPDFADMPHPPRPPAPPMIAGEGPGSQFFFRRVGGGRRLGIAFQEMGEQLARYFKVEDGVLVTDVEADSAAGKAGVKAGDVIVSLDGKAVKDGRDLHEALRDASGTVTIGVRREGRAMDVSATLPEADESRPVRRTMRRGGARI